MKKLTFAFAALVAALSFAACNKVETPEETPVRDEKQKLQLHITVGDPDPATKAVKSQWDNGDVINVWFDTNVSQTPDMTLTYNGSAWDASDVDADIVDNLKESGTLKFFWEGSNNLAGWTYTSSPASFRPAAGMPRVMLPSSNSDDNQYTFDADNQTLTAHLKWSYGTNFQIVVKDLSPKAGYQLKYDSAAGLDRVATIEFGTSTVFCANEDGYASGVANEEGVAFNMFLDSDGEKTFTFSLRDSENKEYVWSTTKTITFAKTSAADNFFAVKLKKEYFFSINGHEYVDMGTGVKWATMNMGATSPEGYGDYFAWGETEPYYSSLEPLQWKEGKAYGYAWNSYSFGKAATQLTKYVTNTSYGTVDNKTVLEADDDAATSSSDWGSPWRMPTQAEWTALINTKDNADYTWTWCDGNTTRYNNTDAKGMKIVWESTGATLFLPAAGNMSNTGTYTKGTMGNYWSSSLTSTTPSLAGASSFISNQKDIYSKDRCMGLSIRPVSD